VRSPADVDAVLAEAEHAGGTIVRPAARADWGGTTGAFADPDGYVREVAHNPSACPLGVYVARQLEHGADLTKRTYGPVIYELEDAPQVGAEDGSWFPAYAPTWTRTRGLLLRRREGWLNRGHGEARKACK
jgi:hypothetical protein